MVNIYYLKYINYRMNVGDGVGWGGVRVGWVGGRLLYCMKWLDGQDVLPLISNLSKTLSALCYYSYCLTFSFSSFNLLIKFFSLHFLYKKANFFLFDYWYIISVHSTTPLVLYFPLDWSGPQPPPHPHQPTTPTHSWILPFILLEE